MNQIRVATRPYSGKTRWVLDSLKGFGLKKPNAVIIDIVIDNTKQSVKISVNGNLYKEGAFGEIKNLEKTSKIRYNNGSELVQVLGSGLIEAGFPVKIRRQSINFSKGNPEIDDEFYDWVVIIQQI